MIEVRYLGRLGNNLFQYCLGRILADNLGFALQAEAISGFPKTGQSLAGQINERPEQILTGHRIDLARILSDRRPRRIVLAGFFQCHEYYRPYRAIIREWLAFDSGIRIPILPSSAVVVNVRRTDYVQYGWALPFSFYEDALRLLQPRIGELWIVTDDRNDPFFKNFEPWKPNYFSAGGLEQMMFMTKASRLVMSQSTFSWWPTFLSDQQEVVCPFSRYSAWSKTAKNSSASEASLIERDRFTCIECRESYEPTVAEALHQKRRLARQHLRQKLKRLFRLIVRD